MLNLETAQSPHKLRRVAIEPVSRVEGHGKVTILLDEENRVHQVRLHIVEFRGFEVFIEGRPFWEVPVIVQRLCGICPVSHHIAAGKAMDIVAGYGPLTPTAEKLRRLLHYGQIVQSHALHFFHLASPDLLFGFDSEVSKRNIVGVAAAFPDLAKRGVMTRKWGQEVIRHIVGKRIHGTGVIPGGMNKPLHVDERDTLRRDVDEIVGWARELVDLVARLYETNPDFYKRFGEARSNMMGARQRGRRDRLLPRRLARPGRRRRADLRPRRLHDLPGCVPGRDQALELHEVPAHQGARGGKRLVSRRPAGARPGRRPPVDAARRGPAAQVRRARAGQAAARRADVPLGADDRDAQRRRDGARPARTTPTSSARI